MASRFKLYFSNGWLMIWRPSFPKWAGPKANGGWWICTPRLAIWWRSCDWLEAQRYRFQR